VNGKQQRRDKQEGELQRFSNAHQHGGQRGRDQQPATLTRFSGAAVYQSASAIPTEPNTSVAVQREPAFREQGFQRQGALAEFLQMLRPVDLNTAFHRRRAEDERAVDEVVQSGWDQNAFQEGVHPHASAPGRAQERLKGLNAHLHFRPAQQCQPGAGDHAKTRG
jgi:hypothetical protein